MPDIREIAPGVRLCAEKTNRFKTGAIRVTMAVPLDGNESKNSIMTYLLKRSCRKYPDFTRLNGRLDELYGASLRASVMKASDALQLSLSITYIDDRFALDGKGVGGDCAKLLADMLFDPDVKNGAFNAEYVESEKAILRQRLDEEINDKRDYALKRCDEIQFAGEAYARSRFGTYEEIDAVTPEGLYETWQKVIKTAPMIITVVGSAKPDKVIKVFEKAFSAVERNPVEITTVFKEKAGRFHRVCEEMKVNQGKLVLGFRTGMKDSNDNYVARVMMNDLFGGNVYSKLFLNVREKLQLCYYCSSRLNTGKGVLNVSCGIDTENEKKATAEIIAQLNDLRNGKFTDEDMTASRMGMKVRWLNANESPEGICSWYCIRVLDDVIRTPEELVAEIEGVTREQICEMAKKLALETVFMLSAEQEGENENN